MRKISEELFLQLKPLISTKFTHSNNTINNTIKKSPTDIFQGFLNILMCFDINFRLHGLTQTFLSIIFSHVVVRIMSWNVKLLLEFLTLYIRGLFKKYREFCVCSKIREYLFCFLKVIPIIYYSLAPTFLPILEALQKIIFCDLVQLLLRCRPSLSLQS